MTVQTLRSFVGTYSIFSRVLRGYAGLLDPLDMATVGKISSKKIVWSDELLHAFMAAQNALKDRKTIVICRPDDLLWIITDGSVKNKGIAVTMYAHRNGRALSGVL